MAADFNPISTPEETQSKSKIWIILAVVLVVLLCCCCFVAFGGGWLWNNGDQLIEEYGVISPIAGLIA